VILVSTGGNAKVVAEVTASTINCCKLVKIHDISYLVVGSSAGMQIWSGDGETLKFFSPLSGLINEEVLVSLQDTHQPVHMKGIAVCAECHIVIGCSTGHVFVIEVPAGSNGEDMSILHTLGPMPTSSPIQSGSNIVAIGGSDTYTVCANEYGDIHILDGTVDFRQKGRIDPNTIPTGHSNSLCNGLVLTN